MAYRLKKLVRKHRVATLATLAVLAALVVGLMLMALGLARATHAERVAMAERDRANIERDRANAQRDQAQQNLQLARELMSDVIVPATERLFDFPFGHEYQGEVLEQARVFYERLLQQAEGDPELRRELAQIYRSRGYFDLGTGQDGEPEYRRSLAILADLAKEFPGEPRYREELGWAHFWLGVWDLMDLRLEEALEQFQITMDITQDLAAEFPANDQYRQSLQHLNHELGRRLTGVGRFDEALNYHRAALTDDAQVTPRLRIHDREMYAYLLLRLARYEEADQVMQEALQIAEQELASHTSPPTREWAAAVVELGRCHHMVGLVHFYAGRLAEAEVQLRHAIDLLVPLSDEYSQSVWPPYWLGDWYHDLAEVLTVTGRLEEAEEARQQSLAAWESAGTPVALAFPHGKALAHYRLGELLHATVRTEEARHQFDQALAIMEDLARRRTARNRSATGS